MFIRLIGFAIKYAPLVVSAITLVEGLVAPGTSGADKKALVIKTVKEFLARMGVTVNATMEALLSQTIDIAVTLFNLFGIFKRKDDPDADGVEAPVPAEKVAEVATVIRTSGNEARLEELEALLKR